MQFNRDLHGSRNLQNTHGPEIVEVDLGIGHIVHDDEVVLSGKLHGLLEKAAISTGCRRVVGIIEPEQTRLCQYVRGNGCQVGQVAMLFAQGQQASALGEIL